MSDRAQADYRAANGESLEDDSDEEADALATVTEIWPTYSGRRDHAPPNPSQTRLNEKYTFETFVIGASNRFAHAAAVAVAEAPAVAYNPLFVWGDSGLGKTHLLHGIGHYAQRLFPGMRVRYVSSEEFTNDFINSLRDDRKVAFQRRYRDVDVLLVDDIQFLEGKEGTQEEFFHTFNTLYNANKQIVISSDRPPKRLETLEDRMRTRFEWGLTTDIQPPELETRIAILRKKAALDRMNAPDDVLEFIASRIERNIRELEGALIRVTAFASLNKQTVDLALAQIVLRDLIRDPVANDIDAATIMAVTAEYFAVTLDELCGPVKTKQIASARQIAMYLCRELTDLTLPKIGQTFGGRDHTTVMHAAKKIRTESGRAAADLRPRSRTDREGARPGSALRLARLPEPHMTLSSFAVGPIWYKLPPPGSKNPAWDRSHTAIWSRSDYGRTYPCTQCGQLCGQPVGFRGHRRRRETVHTCHSASPTHSTHCPRRRHAGPPATTLPGPHHPQRLLVLLLVSLQELHP